AVVDPCRYFHFVNHTGIPRVLLGIPFVFLFRGGPAQSNAVWHLPHRNPYFSRACLVSDAFLVAPRRALARGRLRSTGAKFPFEYSHVCADQDRLRVAECAGGESAAAVPRSDTTDNTSSGIGCPSPRDGKRAVVDCHRFSGPGLRAEPAQPPHLASAHWPDRHHPVSGGTGMVVVQRRG